MSLTSYHLLNFADELLNHKSKGLYFYHRKISLIFKSGPALKVRSIVVQRLVDGPWLTITSVQARSS